MMEKDVTKSQKEDGLGILKLTSGENSPESSSLILKETKLIATWLFQKPTNTRRAYESDIKKFFSFYKGKTLRDFESAHIVVYFKMHPDLAPATRARLKSSLSSLFRFLIKERYLEKNPVETLDKIKVPDTTHKKTPSLEEIKEVLRREENPRNLFLIRFLAKTGLRVSEACSLKKSNFRKSDGDAFISVLGKGEKVRTFSIGLDLYKEVMDQFDALKGDPPLFRSKKSMKPLTPRAVFDIVRTAGSRVGLYGLSPHWLRHFHATQSLKEGDDIRVIQNTLGHESLLTTVKYTKVYQSQSSGKKIKI